MNMIAPNAADRAQILACMAMCVSSVFQSSGKDFPDLNPATLLRRKYAGAHDRERSCCLFASHFGRALPVAAAAD